MSDLQWELDERDARFLESIRYYSGEASMRQIRERSGLDSSAANYRFEKLENLDLIHVHTRPYKGKRMRIAGWTDKLKEEIENGLLSRLDYNLTHSQEIYNLRNEVRELQSELEKMENRINSINSSVQDNRSDLKAIEDGIEAWSDSVHDRLSALASAVRIGTEEEPEDYLES